MSEFTFYDLCAEDHYLLTKVHGGYQITMEVLDDEENTVYKETSNIAAWDSLVEFSKKVLQRNEQVQKEREKYE